jgi:hypothetical protein
VIYLENAKKLSENERERGELGGEKKKKNSKFIPLIKRQRYDLSEFFFFFFGTICQFHDN